MQANQVKEKFPIIHRSIDHASQLCQTAAEMPEDLRNFMEKLDHESDQVNQVLSLETNDGKIMECIERLEKLGDQAMQACKQAGNAVDGDVQSAVRKVHDAISDLKHQLH